MIEVVLGLKTRTLYILYKGRFYKGDINIRILGTLYL